MTENRSPSGAHDEENLRERSGDAVAASDPALAAAATQDDAARDPAPLQEAEFDHRGIRLPARSRVGGIITPQ